MESWHVYIVRCKDNTLYTGIAKDVERRINEHNTSLKGARYTRFRRPVKLVYCEPASSRATASRREYLIKSLTTSEKVQLVAPAETNRRSP